MIEAPSLKSIDPDRPWVGSAYLPGASVFVLGESYVGAYEDDAEYDDVYWAECLSGQRKDPLFSSLHEKLRIAPALWWPAIAFTNLCIGSIGPTTQTVVTSAQLRAGLPRLERLLARLQPRGVLVLGGATRRATADFLDRRGIAWAWTYHPSGKNNRMHGGRYACTPGQLQDAWRALARTEKAAWLDRQEDALPAGRSVSPER